MAPKVVIKNNIKNITRKEADALRQPITTDGNRFNVNMFGLLGMSVLPNFWAENKLSGTKIIAWGSIACYSRFGYMLGQVSFRMLQIVTAYRTITDGAINLKLNTES
jgi:hypothetical protein